MKTTEACCLLFLCLTINAVSSKIITKVEINSTIMYRYAQTIVKSTMKNTFDTAQEVTFNMTLSEEAFISNFTVTSDGEEFVAKVLDREEAIQTYNDAKDLDKNAGLVNKDHKRSFTISVNVRPQEKIIFHLTYDERLQRQEGSYRYQIYLNSMPQLDEISVDVKIKESLTITNMTISQANNTNDNWVPGNTDVQFGWAPQRSDYASVMKEGLREDIARLSLVQLLYYFALIGRVIFSDEIFS